MPHLSEASLGSRWWTAGDVDELAADLAARQSRLWRHVAPDELAAWAFADPEPAPNLHPAGEFDGGWAEGLDETGRRAWALAGWAIRMVVPEPAATAGEHWHLSQLPGRRWSPVRSTRRSGHRAVSTCVTTTVRGPWPRRSASSTYRTSRPRCGCCGKGRFPVSPVGGALRIIDDDLVLFLTARSVDVWVGLVPELLTFGQLVADAALELGLAGSRMCYHAWSAHLYEVDYLTYLSDQR